jgi:very-short-patch-repair endonuclease
MFRNPPQKTDTSQQQRFVSWCRELGLAIQLETPFGPYWADIYLEEIGIIIELDGPYHNRKRDEKRDQYIQDNFDIEVWRFKNDEILERNKEVIIQKLQNRIETFA